MAARKSKTQQARVPGDVFIVPLVDGTFAAGQILGDEREALNSTGIALFDCRVDKAEHGSSIDSLPFEKAFAVLLATPDLLKNKTWPVVHSLPVRIRYEDIPYNKYRPSGWVGAKIIGSGIVNQFVNAFYGLEPWDGWKDPDYLDGLLLSPEKKPSSILLKRDFGKRAAANKA